MAEMFEEAFEEATRTIVAAHGSYAAPLASPSRGTLRGRLLDNGDGEIEIDLPDSEAGRAVIAAHEASDVVARPFIDPASAEFSEETRAEGERRVAVYTKASLRAIIVSSTDAREGWPDPVIRPTPAALMEPEGRAAPVRRRRVYAVRHKRHRLVKPPQTKPQPKPRRQLILDTGRGERSTGTRDRREAEALLARYIAERDRPTGPATPDQMTVAEVLAFYGNERAPAVKDPTRIGYAIQVLAPIVGSLPVAGLNSEGCRRYAKTRGKAPGTVRKELSTLQAAVNYCHAEGYLTAAPKIRLPAKPPARDRWLTRNEVARLLRVAYRSPRAKHLARFILVAIYTGTRSDAILRMRYMPSTEGGWVVTHSGRMHRRGIGVAESKKRQPPIPIPRQLLAHLCRWERQGARYVVEIDGQRVGSVKRAWRTALAEAGLDHCTRHDLRHTAITWAMQRGADKWAAAGFFGVGLNLLERVYGHHHPDYLESAVQAMERKL